MSERFDWLRKAGRAVALVFVDERLTWKNEEFRAWVKQRYGVCVFWDPMLRGALEAARDEYRRERRKARA